MRSKSALNAPVRAVALVGMIVAAGASARSAPLSLRDTFRAVLPPIPAFESNPCAQAAVAGVQRLLAEDAKRAATGESQSTPWVTSTRAAELGLLCEAYAHPQSPFKGDPQLQGPIVWRYRRLFEDMRSNEQGIPNFHARDLGRAFLILDETKPTWWEADLRELGVTSFETYGTVTTSKMKAAYTAPGNSPSAWVNGDIRFIEGLYYAGRICGRPEFTALADKGMEYIARSFLPDGGFCYAGEVNETFTYHEANVLSLAVIGTLFGHDESWNMLVRSRWYYPLSIEPPGVAEYSTAACWKPYWNMTTGSGGAAVIAAVTNCPHNARIAAIQPGPASFWQAAWYRPDLTPAPAPDQYFVYDRNLEGPRGRFGRWSFSGTTRPYPTDKRGKSTFAGCMVLDPKDAPLPKGTRPYWKLNAAVQDVGSEIRVQPESAGYKRYTHNIYGQGGELYASLAAHDAGGSVVAADAAALASQYSLSQYKRDPLPWTGTQQWLFTPTRLVGMLRLRADAEQQAYSVSATLKLVSGRAYWGARKEVVQHDELRFSYGDLRVVFHEHNYAGAVIRYEDTYNGDTKKTGRISLLDAEGMKHTEARLNRYAAGTEYFAVVEIMPRWAVPAETVRKRSLPGGLLALEVVEPGGRGYFVVHNPTDAGRSFQFTATADMTDTVLHLPGERHRPAWMDSPLHEAAAFQRRLAMGAHSIACPAGQLVLIEWRRTK